MRSRPVSGRGGLYREVEQASRPSGRLANYLCGAARNNDVVLVSVVSNEPDDAPGTGDGHTTNDIQEAQPGTPDFKFQLRAERDGNGMGRVNRVTYQAVSPLGETVTAPANVRVPKSQAKKTPGAAQPGGKDLGGGKKGGAGEFGGSETP